MDQVFEDPQVRHLGQVAHVEHPLWGRYPVVTSGLRLSATPPVVGRAAPRLGEHTREILVGELGLSDGEVNALIAKGVLEYRAAAGDDLVMSGS
jgi:crotonobetainyl-CoA:carnitine CoA-transferase CaiB-like acyl-CoA transferase